MAPSTHELVGNSPALEKIRNVISRAAPTSVSVLITGETGTGKELVARSIHAMSGRKGAFVAINCGALPEPLVESELFGHRRGAFTGAHENRQGAFSAAAGGTLMLDEIGDMPLHVQVKLLRALDSGEFMQVGCSSVTRSDARVVCATNRNIDELMKAGKFREDLYYRVNTIHIKVPPLREHPDDIPLLAEHFLSGFNAANGMRISIEESGMAAITRNCEAIGGNIRGLRSLIERAAVFSEGGIIRADNYAFTDELPKAAPAAAGNSEAAAQAEAVPRQLIDAIGPHSFKIDLRPRKRESIVRQIELLTGLQAGSLNGHLHDVHGLIKKIRRLALEEAAGAEGLDSRALAARFNITEATVYSAMRS
ncbi:MAG: sigma-54 dependent transcriptional regulator [Candidatus Micrarchaeota archaeon]